MGKERETGNKLMGREAAAAGVGMDLESMRKGEEREDVNK